MTEELNVECVHYWILEPHRTRYSKGVCKKCGAEDKFDNESPRDYFRGYRWVSKGEKK